MKPGRELDKIIAEKVMGWVDIRGEEGRKPYCGSLSLQKIPHYSTDISASWEVVEKLRQQGFRLELRSYANGYGITFESVEIEVILQADTAPHAICLAALKTVKSAEVK